MSGGDALFLRVDGVDVDPADTCLGAADRGFNYGDGVFRTVRVSGGRVLAWSRHARKLVSDLARIGLGGLDLGRLEADLAQLAMRHPGCIARITVTAGASARGYRRSRGAALTTVVRATTLPQWPADRSRAGIALHLCRLRLADQPALAGVKHLNRLEQVLARAEWDENPADIAVDRPDAPSDARPDDCQAAVAPAEGLTLDGTGHAICGTMSNLFIVEGGRLATPDLSRCGVEGVQRGRIIDWARTRGVALSVEPLPLARVRAADSLVVCNSVIGAWWVARFSGRRFARPAWQDELERALEHELDRDGEG